MRILGLIFLIFLLQSNVALCQETAGRSITVSSSNYDQDYVVIGYYYGDRQLVLDTVRRDEENRFTYSSDEALKEGVYLLLLSPNNRYIQFIVNEGEGDLSIQLDTSDLGKPIIKGSVDNQLFLDYITFLNVKGNQNEKLNAELKSSGDDPARSAEIKARKLQLDSEVKKYQSDLIEINAASVTAKLISSTLDVKIPEFEGSENEVKNLKYYHYRENFFENIDLGNQVYLRTPFLHNKIETYMSKLVPQAPDSINLALDQLLEKMEPAQETYQFYLSYFLNQFARSKVVGQDGVYVHLVDNYYAKGKTPWVEEEQVTKIVTEANKIRPTLIGKVAQDIKVYRKDKSPVSLSDIKTKYLILYFWAPDCGHCKKATPHVIDFYNKAKDSMDIEILAICTKHRDKEPDCWDSVEEKGMDIWINASDVNHLSKFRSKYNVEQTPAIFILNENREIIMKKIGAEYLDEVMQEIVRIDDLDAINKQMEK